MLLAFLCDEIQLGWCKNKPPTVLSRINERIHITRRTPHMQVTREGSALPWLINTGADVCTLTDANPFLWFCLQNQKLIKLGWLLVLNTKSQTKRVFRLFYSFSEQCSLQRESERVGVTVLAKPKNNSIANTNLSLLCFVDNLII